VKIFCVLPSTNKIHHPWPTYVVSYTHWFCWTCWIHILKHVSNILDDQFDDLIIIFNAGSNFS